MEPISENDSRSLIIPKIIHQTYKTEEIPKKWINEQQSCVNLHSDYKYILWTDEMARNFIKDNYNWFLKTFDSYHHNIMRADVIRYFVLYHYGGIYIDLDDGCDTKLDPLLSIPAWLRKTDPTGVSNDIMASIPKHKFFERVISSLEKYNRNWIVSYITIMYSTGPLFLSVIWKQYLRATPQQGSDIIKVLLPLVGSKHTSLFFHQVQGSSWHLSDAQFILGMGKHLAVSIVGCTMLGLFFLFCEYKLVQWVLSFRSSSKKFSPNVNNSRRKRSTRRLLRHIYATLARKHSSSSSINNNNNNKKSATYTYVPATSDDAMLTPQTAAIMLSPSLQSTSDDYYDEEAAIDDLDFDDDFLDEKSAAAAVAVAAAAATATSNNNLYISRGEKLSIISDSQSSTPSTGGSVLVSAVSSVPLLGHLFSKLFDKDVNGGSSIADFYYSSDDEATNNSSHTNKEESAGLLPLYHTKSNSASAIYPNNNNNERVPLTFNKAVVTNNNNNNNNSNTLAPPPPSIFINHVGDEGSDVECENEYTGSYLSPKKQMVNVSTVSLASSAANDDEAPDYQNQQSQSQQDQSSLLTPIQTYSLRPVTSGSSVGSSSYYSNDEPSSSLVSKTKEN
ncbi:uncharacterized protein SAPINGB_P001057 [Magnusiomyces paraingens]|uniref:Mannosyl phosphorylinositol ceramide synthase SUR1 n=1 Tax=Magnusiomyces paraingens TaxID=2606893 RepID=A0A5E8B4D4_9ASCO|nr:uncharacterized protein SAPINGB_P001057 [Saprochaete ingens]VVT46122.1 unnamed protein product [Saprochaete ingens]